MYDAPWFNSQPKNIDTYSQTFKNIPLLGTPKRDNTYTVPVTEKYLLKL